MVTLSWVSAIRLKTKNLLMVSNFCSFNFFNKVIDKSMEQLHNKFSGADYLLQPSQVSQNSDWYSYVAGNAVDGNPSTRAETVGLSHLPQW